MEFNDIDSLLKYIEENIQDTMLDDVAEVVKDEMSEAIQTSVYRVYQPKYYRRRYGDGGLGARENLEVEEIPDGISVKDVAPLDNHNPLYDLDDIIVNGLGMQPFDRDFYSETAESLKNTNNHTEALKQGLKKRGFKVE